MKLLDNIFCNIFLLRTSLKKQSGAALVEYALILALIALAAVGTLESLGGNIDGIFSAVDDEISDATP